MIENKELGLKIAVDKDEAFWEEVRKKCETSIDNGKNEIVINEHILKLAQEKLKQWKQHKT